MKKLTLLFLLLLLLFGYGFRYTYKRVEQKPNIDKELKDRANKNYLQQHIKEALESDNIDDAKIYINLAHYLNVTIDNDLLKAYKKSQEPLESAIRNVKDFTSGFISGKSENGASLGGAMASDFTVVGDVRDIYKEGSKYIVGEDYNKFILGISLVGIAITASEFITFGVTAPIKTGESVVKVAYKSGKLTKGFMKVLNNKLDKSVNLKLLKQVNFNSLSTTKKSINAVIKSVKTKPFKDLFKNLNKIQKNSSLIITVKLLKYVDNEKDLTKIVKLSSKYKKNTLAVFKVLGKRVLKGGKLAVKYSTKLLLNIAGFIFSLIGFLFTLLFLLKRV